MAVRTNILTQLSCDYLLLGTTLSFLVHLFFINGGGGGRIRPPQSLFGRPLPLRRMGRCATGLGRVSANSLGPKGLLKAFALNSKKIYVDTFLYFLRSRTVLFSSQVLF